MRPDQESTWKPSASLPLGVPTARYAAIYADLADKDKAFAELKTAFDERDWELHRFNVDSYWISLREDPRYDALVKRLNLP